MRTAALLWQSASPFPCPANERSLPSSSSSVSSSSNNPSRHLLKGVRGLLDKTPARARTSFTTSMSSLLNDGDTTLQRAAADLISRAVAPDLVSQAVILGDLETELVGLNFLPRTALSGLPPLGFSILCFLLTSVHYTKGEDLVRYTSKTQTPTPTHHYRPYPPAPQSQPI